MKTFLINSILLFMISSIVVSCGKERSVDLSGSSGSASGLVGNWKLLYMTANGYETGDYTENGKTYRDVYIYKDSTTNNKGVFTFTKDSMSTTGLSYNESGNDWFYSYENNVKYYGDSSTYNDPVTDVDERLPYKIKGDSIQLLYSSGMFGTDIPATYKYVITGDKLSLLGRFTFIEKDTTGSYIETYNVNIGANIYLQKQ